MKICIIIPIKHNSERIPGKNFRDFNGKPLFHIILNTLLKSKYINHIYVDTPPFPTHFLFFNVIPGTDPQ